MVGPRPWIKVPDGRYFYGIWPQDMSRQRETDYIIALAAAVRGVCEVTLPVGRADVATGTIAFEVEPVGSWRAGARQAFGYAAMAGLEPAVALFGHADYLKIYLRIRDRMRPLGLWVFGDGRWRRITNRRDAMAMSSAVAHQLTP